MKALVPGGGGAGSLGWTGSRRLTRDCSWPSSYRRSQYDSVSRSRRFASRRMRSNTSAARIRTAPKSNQGRLNKRRTLSDRLRKCQGNWPCLRPSPLTQ
jgi:hypothetical protein